MTNIPNFLSSAGGGSSGGSKIGDEKLCHESGYIREEPDGTKWLGDGSIALASAFPQAAKLEYMQAVGIPATLPNGLSNTFNDVATDGEGRWVIAYQHATNVMVSTDNGATWANVAHNAGSEVKSVCYSQSLGLFISAGNSVSQFYTSSVAAASVGSAWTARTGTAITGSPTANTAIVRAFTGNTVVMACSGASAGGTSRSTNGTSWTATVSSTNNLVGQTTIARNAGTGWVVGGGGGGSSYYSTDDGVTWTPSAVAASSIKFSCFINGAFFVYSNSSTIYRSTDNGATFSLVGRIPITGSILGGAIANGVVILEVSGSSSFTGFYYSTDGINFKAKMPSFYVASVASGSNLGFDGVNIVSANAVGGTTAYRDNFNNPTYIGSGLITLSGASATAFQTLKNYRRIY